MGILSPGNSCFPFLARLRSMEVSSRLDITAVDTLRAVNVAVTEGEEDTAKPPPETVLKAILEAQRDQTADKSLFLEALAGTPGRRWELAYIAGKPAVVAARKQAGKARIRRASDDGGVKDGNDSWYRPLERLLLPWTRLRDGLYIDSKLVSAVQNFDAGTMVNKNGVYRLLNGELLQTTVEGPFSWNGNCDPPNSKVVCNSKRKPSSVCAFRPTVATFTVGPFKFDQPIPEELPFDQTPIRDLPFFKFIHVDDKVAVAMGRSGSVALWTRMVDS
mmetsp:Transcript_28675/g.34982  ORF Transcript_28675/g.34982 Transcript_28675/m.34982 type:complete len:275 (+) Transcript_28675:318-1142(+)